MSVQKLVPMVIAGGVLAAGAGGFGVWTATAKEIQLTVDGVPTTVSTHAGTVSDVLADQGVTLGPIDEVLPFPSAAVSDGTEIAVRHSRDVTLEVEGKGTETISTLALTVDELMKQLSYREESVLSTSRSTPIGREGLSLSVDPALQIELVDGGQPRTLVTTRNTVGEALDEAGVVTDADDEVVPVRETLIEPLEDTTPITVNRVEFKDQTEDSPVPFETVRRSSTEVAVGKTKVSVKGVDGVKTQSFREKFVNGASVERLPVGEGTVTKAPVDEVVLVGKEAPKTEKSESPKPKRTEAPAKAPATKPSSKPSKSSGSSSKAPAPAPKQQSGGDAAASGVSPAKGNTCSASFYHEGQMTASGERFDPNAMTAAHKTLPMNTRVKVTNPKTGKTVVVRINDRGPYVAGRCLDLSRAAFGAIAPLSAGHTQVVWEVL